MRVIIVEDSPVVRSGLREIIESEEGVSAVAEAASVRDAERLLEAVDFDLWVLDFDLADGTALDLLDRKVREAWAGTVAVLTKHGEEPIRRRCLEAGADCFYDKAADLDRALEAFRAFVGSGSDGRNEFSGARSPAGVGGST